MTLQAKLIAALSALSVVLALSAAIFYYRSQYIVADALSESRGAEVTRLQSVLNSQIELLKGREETAKQVQQIRVDFESMKGDIRIQGRKIDEAVKQVKENDQTVRDYLSEPVPDALGRLFVRPATYDPRLYGIGSEGGTMHPDSVPSPGIPSTKDQ